MAHRGGRQRGVGTLRSLLVLAALALLLAYPFPGNIRELEALCLTQNERDKVRKFLQ